MMKMTPQKTKAMVAASGTLLVIVSLMVWAVMGGAIPWEIGTRRVGYVLDTWSSGSTVVYNDDQSLFYAYVPFRCRLRGWLVWCSTERDMNRSLSWRIDVEGVKLTLYLHVKSGQVCALTVLHGAHDRAVARRLVTSLRNELRGVSIQTEVSESGRLPVKKKGNLLVWVQKKEGITTYFVERTRMNTRVLSGLMAQASHRGSLEGVIILMDADVSLDDIGPVAALAEENHVTTILLHRLPRVAVPREVKSPGMDNESRMQGGVRPP